MLYYKIDGRKEIVLFFVYWHKLVLNLAINFSFMISYDPYYSEINISVFFTLFHMYSSFAMLIIGQVST